jgi:arylformamidase
MTKGLNNTSNVSYKSMVGSEKTLKIYDLSLTIYPGMQCWPNDTGVELTQEQSLRRGGAYNCSRLVCSSHIGTHIDAPYHFTESGKGIDEVSLYDLIGKALVVEIAAADLITAAELRDVDVRTYKRILFKTRNSALLADRTFHEDYVALDYSAAELLVENGVKVVGIDYLSIEPFTDTGHPVHKLLTENGVLIIETLDLRAIEPGAYFMVALPLKLKGCDGAPARVVLVEF